MLVHTVQEPMIITQALPPLSRSDRLLAQLVPSVLLLAQMTVAIARLVMLVAIVTFQASLL